MSDAFPNDVYNYPITASNNHLAEANGASPLVGASDLPQLSLYENVHGVHPNGVDGDENDEESTEDEMEWEEVDLRVGTGGTDGAGAGSGLPTKDVTITLSENVETPKKRTVDRLQLQLRLTAHKLHTISLLASLSIRNKWINDPLLHARLISLTPLHLQTAFSQIHVKLVPDQSRRSRLFMNAIFKLTEWWFNWFTISDEKKGMRSRTYLEVEKERLLSEKRKQGKQENKRKDVKGKGKATAASSSANEDEDEEPPYSDRLRSVKSLMKHALLRSGSRDTSAILFTALCRALDVPARLVVSLQSMPWSAKSEKMKWSDLDDLRAEVNGKETIATDTPTTGKGKGKDTKTTASEEKGKSKEKVVKLRRPRPNDRRPRPSISRTNDEDSPPLEGHPPVVWTEVYSRPEGKWVPVDCVRYLVDKRKLFEPPEGSRVNRMGYVVAWEEDGYAKDVTVRYAKQFGAKTVKSRASTRRGQSDWWEFVMVMLTRPYRLNRDDVEDNEFRTLQYWEGMPTSIGGFKDHPIYALERHLRTDEVIHPRHEIGKFRGEPVFSRSDIQRVRTAETWLREGRVIRMGQQPLKRGKIRASTINKKREWEMMKEREREQVGVNGGEEGEASELLTQGLYALWQTELYVPDPVIEGKIPKNDFGNINLFVKSMLPYGATHLPYQGIAKIAKTLGIDFAPAVTGFEFRKGHANPIITGIVVASENEDVVLSAYWESAQAANEAEAAKRYDRVIRRWTRLVQGLRLRKRLQEEYGNRETVVQPPPEIQTTSAPEGGFLTEYDGVIEHFNLPKTRIFQQIQEVDDPPQVVQEKEEMKEPRSEDTWAPVLMEQEALFDGISFDSTMNVKVQPKTLRQRAAEHYARRSETSQVLNSSSPAATPPPQPAPSRKRKATRKARESFSSDDSTSEFENVEQGRASKRTRSLRKRPSPPSGQRQLRPRVHK